MAQFTSPEGSPTPNNAPDAVYVSQGPSERPRGIGLSALALLVLLALSFIRSLLELWGGTLIGAMSLALSDVLGVRGGAAPGAFWGLQLLAICLGHCVAGICIWQYWKGFNWARIAVLLWSIVTTIRTIAFLAENNLDIAALMSRPSNFFPALLAVVLLYWLNTPKVRAWFRKTSAGGGELIADRLRGRLCTAVELRRDLWHLLFEHDAELILGCPWRIVLDDNLVFAAAHDAEAGPVNPAARSAVARSPQQARNSAADQQPPESVPAPSHTLEEARRLVENLRVIAVRVSPRSSDLFLSFEMGIELQTWRASGKANPAPLWEYSDPAFRVIAGETGVKSEHAAAPGESEG